MKVYKIEIDIGSLSNKSFTVIATNFKEATKKAFQMLKEVKKKENYEDAEIYEVVWDADISEVNV